MGFDTSVNALLLLFPIRFSSKIQRVLTHHGLQFLSALFFGYLYDSGSKYVSIKCLRSSRRAMLVLTLSASICIYECGLLLKIQVGKKSSVHPLR